MTQVLIDYLDLLQCRQVLLLLRLHLLCLLLFLFQDLLRLHLLCLLLFLFQGLLCLLLFLSQDLRRLQNKIKSPHAYRATAALFKVFPNRPNIELYALLSLIGLNRLRFCAPGH